MLPVSCSHLLPHERMGQQVPPGGVRRFPGTLDGFRSTHRWLAIARFYELIEDGKTHSMFVLNFAPKWQQTAKIPQLSAGFSGFLHFATFLNEAGMPRSST